MDGRRRLAEPVTDGAPMRPAAGAAPVPARARPHAHSFGLEPRPHQARARFCAAALGSTETWRLPRGAGIAAAIALRAGERRLWRRARRPSAGGHGRTPRLPRLRRQLRGLPHHLDRARRPAPADAARISSTTAGVTGRSSLLFLDAAEARARLKANPWIAEATVLKLYPGRLHIAVTERDAFALWQRDGKVEVIADDGTVVEPYAGPAFAKLPLVVGAAPRPGPRTSWRCSTSIPRSATSSAPRSWSPSGAGTSCSRTASTCGCRKPSVEQALDTLVKLDRDNKILSAATSPRSICACRTG